MSEAAGGSHSCGWTIDEFDRISDVNAGWDWFAESNGAPYVAGRQVVGQDLWSFVSPGEVRTLYELVFRHVRLRRRAVGLFFRCDAPDRARLMKLTVSPLAGQALGLRSTLVRERAREQVVSLLAWRPRAAAADPGRSAGGVSICSFCHGVQVRDDGPWLPVEDTEQLYLGATLEQLQHRLCPPCRSRVLQELGRSA